MTKSIKDTKHLIHKIRGEIYHINDYSFIELINSYRNNTNDSNISIFLKYAFIG